MLQIRLLLLLLLLGCGLDQKSARARCSFLDSGCSTVLKDRNLGQNKQEELTRVVLFPSMIHPKRGERECQSEMGNMGGKCKSVVSGPSGVMDPATCHSGLQGPSFIIHFQSYPLLFKVLSLSPSLPLSLSLFPTLLHYTSVKRRSLINRRLSLSPPSLSRAYLYMPTTLSHKPHFIAKIIFSLLFYIETTLIINYVK